MSYDLDYSTGTAAMAYVGEAPWHRLGEKLPVGLFLRGPDYPAMRESDDPAKTGLMRCFGMLM